ncbi:son of sevenless homolog 1-like [Dendronephthya gigantea]|uniref:son of sevenless homolog 1-like n=1 Tax=Dendronephthya gigantea TaxID=151771 RepID=UPI001069D370|nr:son of sevenless homolog 1-like [Dendronephthya gigantea]
MPLIDGGSDINLSKWQGVFVTALKKVAKEVQPELEIEDAAIDYVEKLIIQLLGHLCIVHPHSYKDVEERVKKTFPRPIDQWCVEEGMQAVGKGKKKNPLVLPVDKIHPLLQKEVLGYKIDYPVSLYIVAVLEYISADILKLAGNYVRNIRDTAITEQHIKVALCADKVLLEMFESDELETSADEEPLEERPITHQDIVKEMMVFERQYIRTLNMIILVFRESFVEAQDLFTEEDIQVIFTNIVDVYEFTVMFAGLLENAIEMAEQDPSVVAPIGECFGDMTEAQAFDCYETYLNARTKPSASDKLYRKLGIYGRLGELLERHDVAEYFQSKGASFHDAVRYVLPRLLLEPIGHCLHYIDLIKTLLKTAPSNEERTHLSEALSVIQGLQRTIDGITSTGTLGRQRKSDDKFSKAQRRKSMIKPPLGKLRDLQKNIEGWEGKDISQLCTELIKDGTLSKISKGGRISERRVFLLDNLMIFCKQNSRHSSSGPFPEYRFKEKAFLRKSDVKEVEDTAELKHVVEILERDGPHITIKFKTYQEKEEWMSSIMSVYLKSTLDRILDKILREHELATPLRLPSVEDYCFAEEDAEDNIVLEEKQNSGGVPVIKGGTLVKLIERLTYHKYSDPSFLKTFLTTYRSFCTPQKLLDMLITRYNIPEPPPTEHDKEEIERGSLIVREDLKRFRKEYSQPVALRVLNAIRQWVDNHFYDFARDPEMTKKLLSEMLSETYSAKGGAVSKWIESIKRIIKRKQEDMESPRELTFEKDPPAIEWHLTGEPEKFDILTLHPIEIARQLTLIESELYRAVKPSELVGSVWTKDKVKHQTSPNLLKLIKHSNTITYWFMKSILEMENFEERVAVLSRIVDILMVFQELNNFSGVMQVLSCIESAAINRLQHTFVELSEKRKGAVDAAKELSADHHKKYVEKLRSINPPCVPFFGMYLSNILKIEDGNPDFLPNYPEGMINFSKRRKVAEITAEIQQYQNQPYCLKEETTICTYLENLDPIENRTDKELEDYFYEASLKMEPRNAKQLPKFPRKTDYNLKGPGIKATSQRNSTIGMGTLRKGSQLSIAPLISEEREAQPPSTPTESPSPLQSPSFISYSDSAMWTPLSDANEHEDPFEQKQEAPPPVIPPRKQRPMSDRRVPRPDRVIKRVQSERIISTAPREETQGATAAPPLPPKSPHHIAQRGSTSFFPVSVDLTEEIEPDGDKNSAPPPLPPRMGSSSSSSPIKSPPCTEETEPEPAEPPALPPRRISKTSR